MNRTLKVIAILFLGIAVFVSWFFINQYREGKEFSTWIHAEAIAFNADEPYLNRTTSEKILKDIKGVRVIGLGEATHGTRESDVMKLELLKLLVDEHNCRVLALEASYSRCWFINKRINVETPIDSLVGLIGFTNLQTVEFGNILQWIRAYNHEHPMDKISIVGIDIQANSLSEQKIEQFYNNYDTILTSKLTACVKKINTTIPFSPASSHLLKAAEEFRNLTIQLRAKVEQKTAGILPKEYHEIIAFQDRIYQNAISYGMPTLSQASHKRDSCMAVNLLSIVDTLSAGKTIALSAHNGHVAKVDNGFTRLGYRLSTKLGKSYYVIGFDFGYGFFRADDPSQPNSPGWENIESEEPSARHLSYYFQQADKPNAFLSLRESQLKTGLHPWVHSKRLFIKSCGSISANTFFNDDTNNIIIGDWFDAVITFAASTPTTYLN